MKCNTMKKILVSAALLLLASCFTIDAQQNLRTGYFLDGYTYGYKLNPAFQGERGFFAFPALGKFSAGLESGMGLSTFLYPSDGKLVTFLHPDVPADDFLGKMKHVNKLFVNADLPVLAFGFRTGKAYHTIDLSVRADAGANLTKDLFSFMKYGSSQGQTSWNMSDLGARMEGRLELSYGYSRTIGDNVSVGARVKMLMGLARADVAMDNLDMKLAGDEWAVNAKGTASVSGPLRVGTDNDGMIDFNSIELYTVDEIIEHVKNPSLGFAIDLGVSADIFEYLTVSASILDLGTISWKDVLYASTPQTSWNFEGFENLSLSGNELEDELNAIAEEFKQIVNLKKENQVSDASSPLSATLHAGLEARLPFYERLSFGALATHRFAGAYSWTEGRFSLNWALLRILGLSGSYALSTIGTSYGAAVNIHLPGFTLFAGVDSFKPLLNVTPQYIPIDQLNTNVTLGLNFAFGKYHGQYPRKDR